ncbi:cellulose binding domain-containing protein [Spirillospora albida]|uniref:cellulose binding domain-containing protein n=1 Tax=Spirillospora albida TaxID=58123 RepID=UPI0004C15AE2|nr:cellulose binding domain-containing protein [Spirillospora albida]
MDGGTPGGEGRPHRGGRRRRPKPERTGGHEPERLSVIGAAVVAVGAVIALTAYAVGDEERPAPCLGEDCAAAGLATPEPTRFAAPRAAHASESAKPEKSPSPSPSPSASATASGSPTAAPSPSTPPRPSAPPSTPSRRPPRPDGGLVATYNTSNSWGSGFVGTLTVVNQSRRTVSDWRLSAYFPGRRITSAWSDGGRVRGFFDGARLGGHGGYLPPGGRISIGFQASGYAGAPAQCTLNGRPCGG